jgi:hypothetical protein
MAILFLLFLLAGLVLGTRFKVLVLVPATALTALAVIAEAITSGKSLGSLLVIALLASTCLQIGYLCGAIIRQTVMQSRANTLRRLSVR